MITQKGYNITRQKMLGPTMTQQQESNTPATHSLTKLSDGTKILPDNMHTTSNINTTSILSDVETLQCLQKEEEKELSLHDMPEPCNANSFLSEEVRRQVIFTTLCISFMI